MSLTSAGRHNSSRGTIAASGIGIMKRLVVDLQTFGFIVATRAMIGAGIGMLMGERLAADRRRASRLL